MDQGDEGGLHEIRRGWQRVSLARQRQRHRSRVAALFAPFSDLK
jgi:hypothetical protein